MKNKPSEIYFKTYKPLLEKFLEEIKSVDYKNTPQPFIPMNGRLYNNAENKILFVGMETKGWGNMTTFANLVKKDSEVAIQAEFDEFDKLEFCNWGNNFGSSFWDFNFKFLANFYNVDDWKKVKSGEEEDILRSFAWGNIDSIERYEVTAEKNEIDFESWKAVKTASQHLDKAQHLLHVFQPKIMVILHWDAPESWLYEGLVEKLIKQEIDDHLWYYFIATTQTHVLWTAHPRWLSKNKNFDEYIKFMVNFVKQKL